MYMQGMSFLLLLYITWMFFSVIVVFLFIIAFILQASKAKRLF